MYDPTTGQFLSEDPIGFDAGDVNLYRYVGNQVTNATDPTGLNSKVLKKIQSKPYGIVWEAFDYKVKSSVVKLQFITGDPYVIKIDATQLVVDTFIDSVSDWLGGKVKDKFVCDFDTDKGEKATKLPRDIFLKTVTVEHVITVKFKINIWGEYTGDDYSCWHGFFYVERDFTIETTKIKGKPLPKLKDSLKKIQRALDSEITRLKKENPKKTILKKLIRKQSKNIKESLRSGEWNYNYKVTGLKGCLVWKNHPTNNIRRDPSVLNPGKETKVWGTPK